MASGDVWVAGSGVVAARAGRRNVARRSVSATNEMAPGATAGAFPIVSVAARNRRTGSAVVAHVAP